VSTEIAPRLVTGTRDLRYGEVLLVQINGAEITAEVYNTFGLNDCPVESFGKLDAAALAAAHGATFAILNGPRYWLMDGIGKVDNVEPVIVDFAGLAMRRAATIEITDFDRTPYKPVTVHRGAQWFFDGGKPVHELRTDYGRTFVMQAYCTAVDPTLSADALAGLADRLALPAGWSYVTRTLERELVIDTTTAPATVLQDEFQNTYSLVR
jgi:hypothetical protein